MKFVALPFVFLALAACSEGLNPMLEPKPDVEAAEPVIVASEPAPNAIPASLPALVSTLEASPPAAALPSGGNIDAVVLDEVAGTVTVSGWILVRSSEQAPTLKVYAPGTVAVVSTGRVIRDDVVSAVGDPELRYSGFGLILQVQPGVPVTDLCISTTDSNYSEVLLGTPAGVLPACSVYAPPPPQ